MKLRKWIGALGALALGFGLAVAAPAPAARADFLPFQLTDDIGPNDQSGTESINLAAGQIFGFYIDSTDGCCGASFASVLAVFGGQFDPLNWILSTGAGDGTGSVTAALLSLTGSDDSTDDVITALYVLVTADTTFGFEWRYSTDDEDPSYDPFGYFIVTQDGQNVPEPGMLALFGLGAISLATRRRRKAA